MDNFEEMDKFLERYSLQRLNQEETENMNRWITSTEIETVTKKLPTNKRPATDGFTGKFYQTFREELTPVLQKRFQKSTEEGTLPCSFYNKTMILIQKTKYHTHRKFHASIIDEHRCKNTQWNTSKPNPTIHWKTHTPWSKIIRGMQGFFNIYKINHCDIPHKQTEE